MTDFEKELEAMSEQLDEQVEQPLPSIEEQKALVEKFKKLEAEGKLTPEILDEHFSKFNDKNSAPIH
jgi:hypothetical protein